MAWSNLNLNRRRDAEPLELRAPPLTPAAAAYNRAVTYAAGPPGRARAVSAGESLRAPDEPGYSHGDSRRPCSLGMEAMQFRPAASATNSGSMSCQWSRSLVPHACQWRARIENSRKQMFASFCFFARAVGLRNESESFLTYHTDDRAQKTCWWISMRNCSRYH